MTNAAPVPRSAPAAPDDEPPIGGAEVGTMLGVDRTTVFRHTATDAPRRLPGFRVGRTWRYYRRDVLRWIAEGGSAPTPTPKG